MSKKTESDFIPVRIRKTYRDAAKKHAETLQPKSSSLSVLDRALSIGLKMMNVIQKPEAEA